MKYFFVDHDNHPIECMKNYNNLNSESTVNVFYTDKSSLMDMNVFEYFNDNNIKHSLIHICDNEKEAVDNRIKFAIIELSRKIDGDSEIYVISRDNGYKSFKNILKDEYGFENYYCVCDFSCEPIPEQKQAAKKKDGGKTKNKAAKKPAKSVKNDNTTSILSKEVFDYMNANKNKQFTSAQIHVYLQQKHKNDKPNFTLKKYGFKTMKQLMKTVEGVKNKEDKYYCA
jgi:hypothetical protein